MLLREARSIYTTELMLLNNIEHDMNAEERAHLYNLRQCASSMDELAPFDAHFGMCESFLLFLSAYLLVLDYHDVSLRTNTLRFHAVDLVPPPVCAHER